MPKNLLTSSQLPQMSERAVGVMTLKTRIDESRVVVSSSWDRLCFVEGNCEGTYLLIHC